jgi:hypothetical protein
VSAATHSDEKIVIASEVYSGDDIRHIAAPRDETRPFVDHAVVEHARLFVARIGRRDQITAKRLREYGVRRCA